MSHAMLLAGDIGGTKTKLAIFSQKEGLRAPHAMATFPSARYPSLEALALEFLSQAGLPVTRASFGVAGPVMNGQATITNLPWVMDEQKLRGALNLQSVRLLNDLNAIAHSVPHLESSDLATINPGQAVPGGAMAVIAPGTGLGEAYLTWDGARYVPQSSEGGHADFAPATADEVDLLRYLLARFGHVSYERVCSGIGIPNIYDYLKESGYAEEPPWLAERLRAAPDRTPAIVTAALDAQRPCPLAAAALDMFAAILASEAGNLTLKVLATGGVYLGGGIPPRILPAFQRERFMAAFSQKGRMSHLLQKVPVHVILNTDVALLGAASHGLEHMAGPGR